MKVEQSMVTKLTISDVPDLDPIAVYLEDQGVGRGKITITCFDDSWSYFWGAMGDGYDIRCFFLKADTDYIAGKLQPLLKDTVNDFCNLEKHARQHIRKERREGNIPKEEARELFEAAEHLETMQDDDPTEYRDLMYRIFGDEWWYNVPQQPNHEYERLCSIINTIKEAIGKKQTAPEGKGYEIRVTDPQSPYCGQMLRGYIIYYDVNHTGDSPHLIRAIDHEGKSVRLLSSQCDMAHYEAQEVAEHIERMGANVGDFVRIIETGSGAYRQGWKLEGIHRITRVDPNGSVEFDDGLGTIFRPVVEVVEVHDG